MSKSIADLKAALDYAKSKVIKFDTELSEMSNEYACEQRELWVNKVNELERQIDESVRILEG